MENIYCKSTDSVSFMIEVGQSKHYKIFRVDHGSKKRFITHRNNIKQAVKLASLLADTFKAGYLYNPVI